MKCFKKDVWQNRKFCRNWHLFLAQASQLQVAQGRSNKGKYQDFPQFLSLLHSSTKLKKKKIGVADP